MYRTVALILAVMAVSFAVGCAGESVRAVRTPEVRPSPEVFEMGRGQNGERGGALEQTREDGYLRIGSFKTPDHVPDYEILEEKAEERNDARAARLLIDTRSRKEEDFVLIARDLKARYSEYDAISVEFTDTEDVLFYNGDALTRDMLDYYGGALIFNTYEGVDYLGYIYGPPNLDGYYVKAAD